jgi:MarR family transcriptional regulator, transcriptional regulator for hemolysin
MAFANDPLFLMHDVARLIRVRADQLARGAGITRAQWVILAWLERQPGISQNELAGLVEVEPITIARLVDRLEARGAVERRLDPKDRRVRRLHLTATAGPLLEQVHGYRGELQAQVFAGVDAEAMKAVIDALLIMKNNLLEERRCAAKAG